MDSLHSFGSWVRRRRRGRDLRQADLADLVGCTLSMIKKIEGDQRRPSRQITERLAVALAIPRGEWERFLRAARAELAVDQLDGAREAIDPFLSPTTGRRHNLPVQPTSFVGREAELTTVATLLHREEVQLVTLTGPGGTGKTRLALQVAVELLDAFPDGVWFVDLAALTEPRLLLDAVVHVLGLGGDATESPVELLIRHLRRTHLLLILDNFERLLATADQLSDVLAAAPHTKLLVTSRIRLHLRAEHEVPLAPLPIPDKSNPQAGPALTQYTAVRLFIERAHAVKPDFAVTSATAAAVAEICTRLDGLPLAIELAAARSKLLPPEALVARLKQCLPLLTGGPRDQPLRHQTLRAAIDWSYDLLPSAAQQLFRRLAVFGGGWTIETAAAICGDGGELAMLDALQGLLDHSLIVERGGVSGVPRFTMLDTLREYAEERLIASGEADSLRRHHAYTFLALAERAAPELHGVEQRAWLQRLAHEHDNLRGALTWSETSDTDHELGLRLGGALGWFWERQGHWREGYAWLTRFLDGAPVTPNAARAKALNWAGRLTPHLSEARMHFEASLAIGRSLDDKRIMADALRNLGAAHGPFGRSEPQRAHALLAESLALCTVLGDSWRRAVALYQLGSLAELHEDVEAARPPFEESLMLFQQWGDEWGMLIVEEHLHYLGAYPIATDDDAELAARVARWQQAGDTRMVAVTLNTWGEQARLHGAYEQAVQRYTESLALWRELGATGAMVLNNLGFVRLRQGDASSAATHFREVLRSVSGDNTRGDIALSLVGLATVASTCGQAGAAACLLGAADALLTAAAIHLDLLDRVEVERAVAATRIQLDEASFARAWADGHARAIDQAVALALQVALR